MPVLAAVETFPQAHLGFPLETVSLFVGIFIISLIVDLVQHKRGQEVTVANAAGWSIFWVVTSLTFAGWIYYRHGSDYASLFLTGYVLEKTLSVDNLMVFIAVFKFFHITSGLQHRILYLGILGAIFFRLIFVALGTGFLAVAGPWAELVFGLFVAYAAIKMLKGGDNDGDGHPDYENMGLVRFFRRFYPVFPHLVGHHFFVDRTEAEAIAKAENFTLPEKVARWMTPAFVCLLVIEGSDIVFSVDSVPAVVAVTKEPLLVYTAMIFAVLGLRSLYFILLVLVKFLAHLEKAVIYILFFIALKMFMAASTGLLGWPTWHISPNLSMIIVLGMLAIGIIASFIWPSVDSSPKPDEPPAA